MGMFDSFYFERGVLPDNDLPPETEFQTKCLECQCVNFRVDQYGWVKFDTESSWLYDRDDDKQINECAYICAYLNDGTKSEYKILIHNSKLVFAEKKIN